MVVLQAGPPDEAASEQGPLVEVSAASPRLEEDNPKVGPESPGQQQQLGALAGALNWASGGVNNIVNLLGTAACQDVFVQEALDQAPAAVGDRKGKSEEVLALPASGIEPCTPVQEPGPEQSARAQPLEEPHFHVLGECLVFISSVRVSFSFSLSPFRSSLPPPLLFSAFVSVLFLSYTAPGLGALLVEGSFGGPAFI